MLLSTFGRRALAATAGAAVVLSVTAVPAQAADHRMEMKRDGNVLAVATWDDSRDTLCIRVVAGTPRAYAKVGIRAVDGQPEPPRDPRQASTTKGQGRYCTPNLSIREDVKYEMQIQWRTSLASPSKLYNSRLTTFFS